MLRCHVNSNHPILGALPHQWTRINNTRLKYSLLSAMIIVLTRKTNYNNKKPLCLLFD